MTQRERLRRDVEALTAEGKISAIVLGILPVGLGLIMYTINPDYMEVLFDETIGNFMLGRVDPARAGRLLLDEEDDRGRHLMDAAGHSPSLASAPRSPSSCSCMLSQAEEKAVVRSSLRQLEGYEVETSATRSCSRRSRERAVAPLVQRPHRARQALHAAGLRRRRSARSSPRRARATRRRRPVPRHPGDHHRGWPRSRPTWPGLLAGRRHRAAAARRPRRCWCSSSGPTRS